MYNALPKLFISHTKHSLIVHALPTYFLFWISPHLWILQIHLVEHEKWEKTKNETAVELVESIKEWNNDIMTKLVEKIKVTTR